MASVHIARWVDMTYMFNISVGVGRGRPNQKLDVMLVQYLLNHATNEDPDRIVYRGIRPPDFKEELVQDGICGSKTQTFIDYYQSFRNQKTTRSDGNESTKIQFQVAQDGAIDPWKFPSSPNFRVVANKTAPLTRTDTLVALCYDAAKSMDVGQGLFADMHPSLVRILCSH